MRAGAVITIPDHVDGPRGQRMRQPGLPGRWCIWSKLGSGPDHHAVTPVDDAARATGAKWACVRIKFAGDAATPEVRLVSTDPPLAMPKPIKHEE